MHYKDFLQYSGNLNILFVDHDDMNRGQFAELLKLFFKSVDVAKDGIEGLHLFREFYMNTDEYYDIVITEVDMPNMGGEQLVKEIKLLNKEQACVVASSSNDSDALINFIKLGIKDFLKKPFSADELQESLYHLSKSISLSKKPDSNDSNEKPKETSKNEDHLDFLYDDENICFDKML